MPKNNKNNHVKRGFEVSSRTPDFFTSKPVTLRPGAECLRYNGKSANNFIGLEHLNYHFVGPFYYIMKMLTNEIKEG